MSPAAESAPPTHEPFDLLDGPVEPGPPVRLTSPDLRRLGRPYRGLLTGVTALALAATAAELGAALALARAFDQLLRARSAMAAPLVTVAVLTAMAVALDQVRRRQATRAAARIRAGLRRRLLRHLADLGPGQLLDQRTGALTSVLTQGVDGLSGYHAEFVPQALTTAVAVLVVVVTVTVLDPGVGAILAAAAVVVAGGPVLSARAFGADATRFAQTLRTTAADYLDAVQGIVTLQAFGASRRWGEGLDARQRDLADDETALGAMATMHLGFSALATAAGTTIGVAVAVTQATHHHLSGSSLLAILTLSSAAFWTLTRLEGQVPAAYRATSLAGGVIDLLDTAPRVTDPAHPITIPTDVEPVSVRFEEVTFRYASDGPPALRDLSLDVPAGHLAVVAGASGAGKSTLVSLLLRFFDPEQGRVSLGPHDVRDLARSEVSRLVAATFQDTYLFDRSVADNLRLARPRASQTDLEAATRAAHLHDVITALPHGYDTRIGEGGRRLSGGERQRLALAVALVSRAPVIVLDEPTAGVDAASEALIDQAIADLRGRLTVVLITHHPHPDLVPDRVFTLDHGRLVTP